MTEPSAEYWTLFYYGSAETICSKHRSLRAAIRLSRACERRGGAKHRIIKVIEVQPYEEPCHD